MCGVKERSCRNGKCNRQAETELVEVEGGAVVRSSLSKSSLDRLKCLGREA